MTNIYLASSTTEFKFVRIQNMQIHAKSWNSIRQNLLKVLKNCMGIFIDLNTKKHDHVDFLNLGKVCSRMLIVVHARRTCFCIKLVQELKPPDYTSNKLIMSFSYWQNTEYLTATRNKIRFITSENVLKRARNLQSRIFSTFDRHNISFQQNSLFNNKYIKFIIYSDIKNVITYTNNIGLLAPLCIFCATFFGTNIYFFKLKVFVVRKLIYFPAYDPV